MKLDQRMLTPNFYPKQLVELLEYFEINGVVIKNRSGHGIKTDNVIELNNQQFTKLKLEFENNDNFKKLLEEWHGKMLRVVDINVL